MSACSVCPFSNLSYARKLPPRVTAIFLLFLVFDLFFNLLWVPVIQNQLRIVLARQSLGIFCREESSLCLCSLSKNRGEGALMDFFFASHSSCSQCSKLNKKKLFQPVDFYSFSIWESLRPSLAIGGQMKTRFYLKSSLLRLAHLKALRVSASTCKHLLCTHVWNATRHCLKNSLTPTMQRPAPALSCGSHPLLAKRVLDGCSVCIPHKSAVESVNYFQIWEII